MHACIIQSYFQYVHSFVHSFLPVFLHAFLDSFSQSRHIYIYMYVDGSCYCLLVLRDQASEGSVEPKETAAKALHDKIKTFG